MTFNIMADHCYAECHLFIMSLMLSVTYKPFILSVIMLNYVVLSAFILSVIVQCVIMLSVVMLNVVMLSVMTPLKGDNISKN